ncbi:hypothetical protein GCM10018980_09200 [Streptomyces capoamus]|uniref:Uncharacterized protein n=1 Tax=Streptomyces capoamus TaxID=68183 RepID=A0A919EU65_9ACTN|nr:hypothetical protein GCM10018980_09200 [Streptomyces capoamus]
MGGDGEDERLEGAAGVAVAGQGEEDGDADLLGEVLHEVARVAGQPGQPGAAVAQRQGVDMREQIVRGLLVPVDGTMHERTDRPVGRARLVVAHRSMVP